MAEDLSQCAPVPPCGWNSFDCFGTAVLEQEVIANAEVLARELLPCGFDTVVVDGGWAYPDPVPCTNPNQGEQARPLLASDLDHRLVPAVERFPSAAGGRGFRPLADRIHALGLRFGIHIMRGFPRQALFPGYPTKHTGLQPSEFVDVGNTCKWLNHMYGLKPDHPDSQRYYDSLFELYASWGVDFVKADDFVRPYHAAEIEMIDRARRRCGRSMVLSLSPGPCPLERAEHVGRHAEMWRICSDFWDIWPRLKQAFTSCRDWNHRRGPGMWPDPDMLPIGRLSRRGPVGPEHESHFTKAELRTLLTLWSIFQAPQFVGGDLTVMNRETLDMLRHPDLVALRRRGRDPRCLVLDSEQAVWSAADAGSDDVFVAAFNLSDVPRAVCIPKAQTGLPPEVAGVRALYETPPPAGVSGDVLEVHLAPHDAALLLLAPVAEKPLVGAGAGV